MVTSIILAGGRSLRLGRCKAVETICGKTLLERVIEKLKTISSQILVITSQEQPDLPVACEAEVVVDIYPGKGPLAGIYTGLLASEFPYSIVVACDMPFLNVELLRYMIELSENFDVVIPRSVEGMIEPLHAIYSKSCINTIRARLERDHLKISQVLDILRVRYVEQEEYQKFDPQHLSFFNVNSMLDLKRATAIATNVQEQG
ncbi:MAG: molybdenum cofactor guanylyltransferase [Dehalococcoidia bacterium]|nr:molybdenum cofactor guanylyltransferase [Dehalococcoidia bacterium]